MRRMPASRVWRNELVSRRNGKRWLVLGRVGLALVLALGGFHARALVVSDPVELKVPDQSDVAVSIFVPGNTGPATWHFEGRQTSFISVPGDFSGNVVLPVSSTTQARFWLAGVEVVASKQTGAIV